VLNQNQTNNGDLAYLSLSADPQGVGKFIVVTDAEERSVYVDMSTSPPTIYGPENRRSYDNNSEVTS
jgi:hypothetical protein